MPAASHPAHDTVQGIDLADQVTLAEAADGRVAGHRADGRELWVSSTLRAHARGRRRRLAAGVAAADHDDVERIFHGAATSSARFF